MPILKKIKSMIETLRPPQSASVMKMNAEYFLRRQLLTQLTLNATTQGIAKERKGEEEVIVSLTSYGRRIQEVFLPIESIMQGTVKADRIILWVDERLKTAALPITLLRQQERGLEIRFTKDIRSYTKLIPALKAFPESLIVTVDDDVIYPYDFLENLMNVHRQHPESICANVVLKMEKDRDGKFLPIKEWPYITEDMEGEALFFEGFGGVLYPTHCFTEEILNEEVFTALCPTADDVWFNAMAKKAGRSIRLVDIHPYDYIANVNPNVQDTALYLVNNNDEQNNDKQIIAVWEKYLR